MLLSLRAGASCLDELLKVNNSLQDLNMGSNDIGDDGMSSIADGLQYNKSLTKLNVQKCGLSAKGTVRQSSNNLVTPAFMRLWCIAIAICSNGQFIILTSEYAYMHSPSNNIAIIIVTVVISIKMYIFCYHTDLSVLLF